MRLAALRDIGLAQFRQHFGGKAGAVIADCDHDLVCSPSRHDVHARIGETHRIFDEGTQRVQNFRTAFQGRRTWCAIFSRFRPDGQIHAQPLEWRSGLGHQRIQRDSRMHDVGCFARFTDRGEDRAAPVGLFGNQDNVLGARILGVEIRLQFLRDEMDRGKRGSQLMCGHCRHCTERGQALLARHDDPRCIERAHEPGLILTDPRR